MSDRSPTFDAAFDSLARAGLDTSHLDRSGTRVWMSIETLAQIAALLDQAPAYSAVDPRHAAISAALIERFVDAPSEQLSARFEHVARALDVNLNEVAAVHWGLDHARRYPSPDSAYRRHGILGT